MPNESGFTGLPGGWRRVTISETYFTGMNTKGVFWSSSEHTWNEAWYMQLTSSGSGAAVYNTSLNSWDSNKLWGHSVRCIEGADCAGVVGGNAVVDCAGECGGDAVLSGCDNACNSTAVVDECGTCDSDASNDCTQDCTGTWGGDSSTCLNVTYSNVSNSSSFQINLWDTGTAQLVTSIPLLTGTYGVLENYIEEGTYYITASYHSGDPNFSSSSFVPDGTQITLSSSDNIIIVAQGNFPETTSTWCFLGCSISASSYINYCSQQTGFPYCLTP